VNLAGVRAGLLEGRSLFGELRDESHGAAGGIVVSGMLAEQLARQLAAGAAPGAVTAREGSVEGAAVAVRVIAGEPSADDAALVRAAEHAGAPVVLVQLWPQADWGRPFVLSPFVVECRPGEGFPVAEIAERIAEAVEHAASLASRVPILREAVEEDVRRGALVRAALLGALGSRKGSTRPALALEQVRTISSLRALDAPSSAPTDPRVVAGTAGLVLASGFVLRAAARAARTRLPAPLVEAAIAVGGTWALTEAVRRIEERLAADEPA
jgi:hypothetical protein